MRNKCKCCELSESARIILPKNLHQKFQHPDLHPRTSFFILSSFIFVDLQNMGKKTRSILEQLQARADDSSDSDSSDDGGNPPCQGPKPSSLRPSSHPADSRLANKNPKKLPLAKKSKKRGPLEVLSNKRKTKIGTTSGTVVASAGRGASSAAPRTKEQRIAAGLLPKRPEAFDPRFSDLCGTLDENAYNRNYEFVDDFRISEKKLLQTELRKKARHNGGKLNRNCAETGNLEKELTKIKQEERVREEKKEFQRKKTDLNKREREKVLAGRKAFFHSDQSVRKALRVEKLDNMGAGRRAKLEANRERRQVAVERKKLVKRTGLS